MKRERDWRLMIAPVRGLHIPDPEPYRLPAPARRPSLVKWWEVLTLSIGSILAALVVYAAICAFFNLQPW